MPRYRINNYDFAKGELSELVEGRKDLDQYYNGAKTLENMLVLEQGAGQRRPGTRFVAETKFSSLASRAVRFVASRDEAFTLEFGEGYFRVYKNNVRIEVASVPIEFATPYAAADLNTLTFSQLNDVLFITSLFYQQRRIEHLSDTVWQIRLEPIDVPPSYEYGTRPGATLTPSAISGTGVTFTASVAQFEASDVGREILVKAGANIGARAKITAYTSQTVVTGNITQNFVNTTANAAIDWKITDSYKTSVTPSAVGPVGASITLTLAAAGWRTGDVGTFIHLNAGVCRIDSIGSNVLANATVLAVLNVTTAASSDAWTREEASWSTFNGFAACDEFKDQRHYYAGTLAQPDVGWGSKVADIGNFAVGALADDAVEFPIANSEYNAIVWLRALKHLIAGTVSAEFKVFGSQDQVITPINVQVDPQTPHGSADDVQPIKVGSVLLYVSTSTRRLREEVFDYVIDGYKSTDIMILAQHLTREFGIKELGYQKEPTAIIWAPRDDGTLLACTYIRDQQVVAWTRQLTGQTQNDPLQEGHQKPLDGFFESHCIIPHPNGDRDQVWLIVRRMVNGVTKRYMEFFDDGRFYYRQLHTDSAVTYDGTGTSSLTLSAITGIGVVASSSAPFFVAGDVGREIRLVGSSPRAIITGFTSSTIVTITVTKDFPSVGPHLAGAWGVARSDLPVAHLEGKTVKIICDGAPLSDEVVTGGTVTADQKGIKMEVGLMYDSTLEPVSPEFQGPAGSVQGVPKSTPIVNVRLFESLGFSINDNEIEDFRIEGDIQDAPPTTKTGFYKVNALLGWDVEGRLKIQQKQPLPFTVTMISSAVEAGA